MAETVILYEGPLVTRKAAKKDGKPRYFTGLPCRHNHIDERFVTSRGCAQCEYDRNEKRRRNRPELAAAYTRKWRDKERSQNPDRWKERNRKYYLQRKANGKIRSYFSSVEQSREYNRKIRRSRRERAAGRPRPDICDVCHESHGTIHFDHCHITGMFRGWLCSSCNKTLGFVKDSPVLLRKLADYLEKPNGTPDKQATECTPIEQICGARSLVSN